METAKPTDAKSETPHAKDKDPRDTKDTKDTPRKPKAADEKEPVKPVKPAKPGKKAGEVEVEVGDVVHFNIPRAMTNREEATHRAAIVSHVYGRKNLIDCHVLVCPHDYPQNHHPGPIMVVTKVEYDEDGDRDGTWHRSDDH